MAPHQGEVALLGLPLGKPGNELAMDVDVEGDEHHPARRLVEAVHELRFAPGKELPVPEAERFDQSARRAVGIGARRPQRQPGRLVDRGEAIAEEEQGGRNLAAPLQGWTGQSLNLFIVAVSPLLPKKSAK